MLKVHTKDGLTTRVDLRDGAQAKQILTDLHKAEFQRRITGISVVQNAVGRARCSCCSAAELLCGSCGRNVDPQTATGVQYSISRPADMPHVQFAVEHFTTNVDEKVRGGERVTMYAGETALSMMVHSGQPSVRIQLSNPGRRLHPPAE